MLIPKFNPAFTDRVHADSPEARFATALEGIGKLGRQFFSRYGRDVFDDFIDRQNAPLFLIDGNFTHSSEPEPSLEQESEKWKLRLMGYGKCGLRAVDLIAELRSSSELLVGKRIDFMMPAKRELNPDSGYINGSHIDYVPAVTEPTPSLFLQIGTEQCKDYGIHYPILYLCNISIT